MRIAEVSHLEFINNVQARLQKEREGIHLSDLELCLKASYYRRLNPQPLSQKQAVMFAIGLGTQEFMYPKAEIEYEVDGIRCSPDAHKIEVKTTREYPAKFDPLHHANWTWRIKGYCHVLDTLTYTLDVVFLGPAEAKSYLYTFETNEIELMWEQACERRDQLSLALSTKEPPVPDHHPDWLCRYCEHSGNCYVKGDK